MLVSGPVLGVAAGLLSGGRLARFADLRISWWPLLAVAVGIRLAAPLAGGLAAAAYVGAFLAIALVALRSARLPGMRVIAAGAALNLAVVALNGGMPVDAGALTAAGARPPGDALHVSLTEASALPLLADRIPLAPFRGVYSLGDVLLTVGGFWLPFRWLRSASR